MVKAIEKEALFCRIDKKLYRKLDLIGKRLGLSKSKLIEEMIKEFSNSDPQLDLFNHANSNKK